MRVITGTARGVRLKTLDGQSTRPTMDQVKEAMFSAIQFEIEGRRVLDLFAGSGQLGIEALSRGAKSAVFVDSQRKACAIIRENLEKTKLADSARVICADYLSYLASSGEKFQIILLDPPYGEKFLENALKKISEIDILADDGIIICERPIEKQLSEEYDTVRLAKNYRYGKTAVSIYRKV